MLAGNEVIHMPSKEFLDLKIFRHQLEMMEHVKEH